MPSRVEAAAILGVSERTVRRYMQEYPEFFTPGRDLSATDLALLRIIHTGKLNGRDTNLVVREQLAACVQAAGTPPTPPAGSVQKLPETQVLSPTTGGQVTGITTEELIRVLQPLVQVVQDLQLEVAGLRRRVAGQIPPARVIVAHSPPQELSWWHRLWLELVDPASMRVNIERSWEEPAGSPAAGATALAEQSWVGPQPVRDHRTRRSTRC